MPPRVHAVNRSRARRARGPRSRALHPAAVLAAAAAAAARFGCGAAAAGGGSRSRASRHAATRWPCPGDLLHVDWTKLAPLRRDRRPLQARRRRGCQGLCALIRRADAITMAGSDDPGFQMAGMRGSEIWRGSNPISQSSGDGAITQNGRAAAGGRKLLIVLGEYSNFSPYDAVHSLQYYELLGFGSLAAPFSTDDPVNPASLREYFRENSGGRFWFDRLGVICTVSARRLRERPRSGGAERPDPEPSGRNAARPVRLDRHGREPHRGLRGVVRAAVREHRPAATREPRQQSDRGHPRRGSLSR